MEKDAQASDVSPRPPDALVMVECDCNCASWCPQGKTGSAPKCRIWLFKRGLAPSFLADHT